MIPVLLFLLSSFAYSFQEFSIDPGKFRLGIFSGDSLVEYISDLVLTNLLPILNQLANLENLPLNQRYGSSSTNPGRFTHSYDLF